MYKLSEVVKTADWKSEKHVPVIEAPATAKVGEYFNVTVTVGKEIPHPNTTEHHMAWIAVHFVPADGKVFVSGLSEGPTPGITVNGMPAAYSTADGVTVDASVPAVSLPALGPGDLAAYPGAVITLTDGGTGPALTLSADSAAALIRNPSATPASVDLGGRTLTVGRLSATAALTLSNGTVAPPRRHPDAHRPGHRRHRARSRHRCRQIRHGHRDAPRERPHDRRDIGWRARVCCRREHDQRAPRPFRLRDTDQDRPRLVRAHQRQPRFSWRHHRRAGHPAAGGRVRPRV